MRLSSTLLILLVSAHLTLLGNFALARNVLQVYPLTLANLPFLLSLAILFFLSTVLILALLCHARLTKPVIILLLLLSSPAAYFMDSYNIIIDSGVIRDIFATDPDEVRDLLSWRMALYLLLIGLVPAVLVARIRVIEVPLTRRILGRLGMIGAVLAMALAVTLPLGSQYASFARAHKTLRYYANPSYYLYSLTKYGSRQLFSGPTQVQPLAEDARIPAADVHRELVLFVVGETARADRFSLNGYPRETNPLLKKREVVSLTNFRSCGTSTAVSVPCMFSIYGEDEYSDSKGAATENLLDVLARAGVHVLWLDNNSSSKGVADRVPYVDYRTPDKNPVCDEVECRDEGMLADLQAYIDGVRKGDVFVVLHQKGNHGPAYYKRYPRRFARFQPECQTNQLEECTKQEIDNAYDNAILYTDYFLSKVIDLLERNSDRFESMMFYVSDHGESLGEHNIYLHSLPNLIAPNEQRHVPAILWLSDSFDNKIEKHYQSLRERRGRLYSHDNLFHSVLGMMEVRCEVYDRSQDLFLATQR